MAKFWFRGPDQDLVSLDGRIRFGWEFAEAAEEGRTVVNTITIDDPLGELEGLGLKGHRIFAIEEPAAEDSTNRFIGIGYIGRIQIRRGPYRNEKGCQWVCEVADLNTVFNRRVMVGTGNKRGDESTFERISWVEGTHEGELIDDTRYMSSADPKDMDAVDYLLQQAISVYDDVAQTSGYNWGLTYFGDVGVDSRNPWGYFSLLYFDPGDETIYPSAVSLSNHIDDIDFDTCFPLYGGDTELAIDPMRIYSTVIVPYRKSYVTASRDTTRTAYARRDVVMNAENVTKKSTALARANRYVSDAASPDHEASVRTIVPRAYVNRIRPGMIIPVRSTYWPGYDPDPLWMRILERRVIEVSDGDELTYELQLKLSRSEPGPPSPPVYGYMRQSKGPFNDIVYWNFLGDAPNSGYPVQPTEGLIEALEDLTPPNSDWPFYGWKINGTGTVDVTFHATTIGVLLSSGAWTITYAICLNGVAVESVAVNTPLGSSDFWSDEQDLSIESLVVAPDDVITATIVCNPPTLPFFMTPAGAGQNNERLEITGGSLS